MLSPDNILPALMCVLPKGKPTYEDIGCNSVWARDNFSTHAQRCHISRLTWLNAPAMRPVREPKVMLFTTKELVSVESTL